MMGVLAVAKDPSRFAKLVLLTPSPCYLDHDGYTGGFSRADIDELLESMESNYLGWSRTMAPTVMGTPDRPELEDELTESFCRNDPGEGAGVRADDVPVRQPRRPQPRRRSPRW